MLSDFSCACWPSVCFLWRNVYLDVVPIFLFFFMLSCMCCLYILEVNLVIPTICKYILPVHRLSYYVFGFFAVQEILVVEIKIKLTDEILLNSMRKLKRSKFWLRQWQEERLDSLPSEPPGKPTATS